MSPVPSSVSCLLSCRGRPDGSPSCACAAPRGFAVLRGRCWFCQRGELHLYRGHPLSMNCGLRRVLGRFWRKQEQLPELTAQCSVLSAPRPPLPLLLLLFLLPLFSSFLLLPEVEAVDPAGPHAGRALEPGRILRPRITFCGITAAVMPSKRL